MTPAPTNYLLDLSATRLNYDGVIEIRGEIPVWIFRGQRTVVEITPLVAGIYFIETKNAQR